MSGRFTVGCVQMTSGREPEANIAAAEALIRQAREAGAELIMTPETTDMIEPRGSLTFEKAQPEAEHDALAAFRDLAAELGIWLLAGSFVVRLAADRLANRSFLIGPGGEIASRYDKIHMFDVEIPDGQSYRESRAYQPGGQAVTADLPWGRLGLTVCYDLRFPQLYRALAKGGADFISVPAAFTRFTGKAHWHVLLRARAIETGCFVFAPAQCGTHAEGRKTFGHALIVAPWGEVLADGGEEPGVVTAEIDLAEIEKARAMVPSLTHDRPFGGPVPDASLREAGE
ncbi:MAG: carbon-nitrogen hydrolase family protein [Rhodospirillales bacterium]|nr:carbon-nitrogen hydrolase family protein [Rhodospirillales bacterium]MDH3793057.1 carbon-nitrogen hydrolase family protein [Rhodospirillales bacterium]MDH3914345.1 carbon-nitrogen hydrolase family protein [Rhodospirillales bacterium]MDH3919305.1 carbon-nitrogen hydrolase family protein [Rhodospirillales bacterium]MDH3965622.1 carbon-nitrogen hydrolase family protein [Rhodospirillales bacterium]